MNKLPRPNRDEFENFYLTMTTKELSVYYDAPERRIQHWMKQWSIRKPVKPPPDREEFLKVYKTRSNQEAADYFDVGRHMIDTWRERLGIGRKTHKWLNDPNLQFTDKQMSIVIGSMLGDGSLKGIDNEKWMSSFNENHGEKQKDYLFWKYNELQPFSSTFVERHGKGKKKQGGKVIVDDTRKSIGYVMTTMAHPIFTELERKWYKRDANGNYILDNKGWRIKCVPLDLKLDELSIAVWYFDDGSHDRNRGQGAVFNTQSFTNDEADFLAEQLNGFGLHAKRGKNYDKPIITLPAKSYMSFMEMITPYLPCASMQYKIDTSNYKKRTLPCYCKLNEQQVLDIMQMFKDGASDGKISDMYKISKVAARDIRVGNSWNKITKIKKVV